MVEDIQVKIFWLTVILCSLILYHFDKQNISRNSEATWIVPQI